MPDPTEPLVRSRPGKQIRRAAGALLVLIIVAGVAAWVSPHVLDPQSKAYAASFKAQQLLLARWLAPAYLGDGGAATDILLCDPMGLSMDGAGNLYVSDRGRVWRGRIVWRIGTDGVARAVAGTGRQGRGRGSEARSVSFGKPEGLAVDLQGRLHIADAVRHTVYRIEHDGGMTRVAGTGSSGSSGDGGPAQEAMLNRPAEIRFDGEGNLYIADVFNHRVRKVDPNGHITTVAGTGEAGFSEDGELANEARLDTPWGIAIDREGRLLIADGENHRIRRVAHGGTLETVAGDGRQGYSGDGGLATAASFDVPQALFVAADGRIFIGDEHNHAVRVVDTDGIVSTVMGTGELGLAEVGDRARGSPLNDPENLMVLDDGSMIIVEGANARIIRVMPDGIVRHVAGTGARERCTSRFPGRAP